MNENMRAGYYCGKVESLCGRRALVRTNVEGLPADQALVQFEDPVTASGIASGTPLNVGWHRLPLASFDLELEYE